MNFYWFCSLAGWNITTPSLQFLPARSLWIHSDDYIFLTIHIQRSTTLAIESYIDSWVSYRNLRTTATANIQLACTTLFFQWKGIARDSRWLCFISTFLCLVIGLILSAFINWRNKMQPTFIIMCAVEVQDFMWLIDSWLKSLLPF